MNFTKILLSTIAVITITTTSFAADGQDDCESARWSGHFMTEGGFIFSHTPNLVSFQHESIKTEFENVVEITTRAKFFGFTPTCDLSLNPNMTARQFFAALSSAATITEIQPPALSTLLLG